jgi:uncharacterized protein (DUF885 family)
LRLIVVPDALAQRNFQELAGDYIEAWKDFYPSRAVSRGFLSSLEDLEDLSPEAIEKWVRFNKGMLERIENTRGQLSHDDRIDARLLRINIRSEIEKWVMDRPHENSLTLYTNPMVQAGPRILETPLLTPEEKLKVLRNNLTQVQALAAAGMKSLKDGRPEEFGSQLKRLELAAVYYQRWLPEATRDWLEDEAWRDLTKQSQDATDQIRSLARHLRNELISDLTLPEDSILGREAYRRKLQIYTDTDLTPERLEQMAWDEIQETKRLIADVSAQYWRKHYPDRKVPEDFDERVGKAFEDVEANRPVREQEYLLKLRQFAKDAEDFVRDKQIATLPEHQTLSIELAPESSGPLARIGYVRSAPPFHPNPWTVWYLATIPDSHPEKERVDFWRSFNYSFKRFIVIHELFPGHYLQQKILRENRHPVRLLFPYRPFTEGWATLCEKVALEAGWAEGDWLTLLAQLRKRLENANRAYMSVQAHCNGWSEEKVYRFSIETSLLAPQFAKSLWGRLMSSPMQIISYMLGNLQLSEVYEAEKRRRGESFRIIDFMDTVLRTGPVPSDELPGILKARDLVPTPR